MNFEHQMELPTAAAELTRIFDNLFCENGDQENGAISNKRAMVEVRQKHAIQSELRATMDLLRLDLAGTNAAAVRNHVSNVLADLDTENDMPEVIEARRLFG